jgi:hypothetical protein
MVDFLSTLPDFDLPLDARTFLAGARLGTPPRACLRHADLTNQGPGKQAALLAVRLADATLAPLAGPKGGGP